MNVDWFILVYSLDNMNVDLFFNAMNIDWFMLVYSLDAMNVHWFMLVYSLDNVNVDWFILLILSVLIDSLSLIHISEPTRRA